MKKRYRICAALGFAMLVIGAAGTIAIKVTEPGDDGRGGLITREDLF